FSMILNALTGTGKRASRCAKDHLLLLLPMTILRQGAGRSLTSDLAQIEALLAATTHVHCKQNRSTGTKFRAGRNITQCSLRATRTLKRPKQRTHIWKCRRKIKKFALQTQERSTSTALPRLQNNSSRNTGTKRALLSHRCTALVCWN